MLSVVSHQSPVWYSILCSVCNVDLEFEVHLSSTFHQNLTESSQSSNRSIKKHLMKSLYSIRKQSVRGLMVMTVKSESNKSRCFHFCLSLFEEMRRLNEINHRLIEYEIT